jgi:hypothetical protein
MCPECAMSFYVERPRCPYCAAPRPKLVLAITPRWRMVLQHVDGDVPLPHRLFNPFSCELHSATAYEVAIDVNRRTTSHVRGTNRLPDSVRFEFTEAVT